MIRFVHLLSLEFDGASAAFNSMLGYLVISLTLIKKAACTDLLVLFP